MRYLGDRNKALRKRVCKLCGEDCPIWSRFSWDRGTPLYEQVARATGTPVVVDSTKSTAWIEERLAELERVDVPALLVFLGRDGRAVVNSRIRKYPERAPVDLIRHWRAQIEASRALYARYEGPKCELSYEQLASEPELTIRQLCGSLDLDFEPGMLAYEQHEHHPLGGNNGTQYLVARSRFADPTRAFVDLPERSRGYYSQHPGAITLDLRWQQELAPKHRALFDELAGDVNGTLKWEA